MDILGIGGPELLVILLAAGIILGPERLARLGREAGRQIRSLKAYFDSFSQELKSELDLLDNLKDLEHEINKNLK